MIKNIQARRNKPRRMPHWQESIVGLAMGVLLVLGSDTSARAFTVYTFSVPDTAPWFDTGINVDSGTMLNIQASGSVVYGQFAGQATGPGGTNVDGVQFFSTAVLPNTTVVSLIGKIGGTTAIGTGTPVPEGELGNGIGYVGSSYNQFITTGGELFLGFNDQIGQFGDNSGSFTVTVTVPEPSSIALAGMGGLVVMGGLLKGKLLARQSEKRSEN